MAGNTTNISIRMDADLKAQADALFAELGMSLSTIGLLIWQMFWLHVSIWRNIAIYSEIPNEPDAGVLQKLSMNPVIMRHVKPHLIHFKKFEKDQVQVAFCLMSDLGSVVSQSSQMVYLITVQHQMG